MIGHHQLAPVAALAVVGVARGQVVPQFSDQTLDAGLEFVHATERPALQSRHYMAPGVGVGDFDRDGHLDLFVAGGLGQNSKLFMNDGDGTFTDRAPERGVDLTGSEGSSVTIGDVDGDGWLDVYAGTFDGPNALLMNTGAGHFVDGAAAAGLDVVEGLPFDVFGGSFGDVDGDGDLDLATAKWGFAVPDGNRLFRNDGGVFTDVTAEVGVYVKPDTRWGFSPALIDLDGDRAPDLPVACDFGTSQYYANLGNGSAFAWLPGNGTATDENGMGSAFGDYDNDGDLDWFVTSIYDDDGKAEGNWGITGNRLYRNDGGHVFTDVTDQAGVRNGFWGWGASFGDFNHDGLLDLAMTNGYALNGQNLDPTFVTDPSRLWVSSGDFEGGPTYVEVSEAAGVLHTAPGKGLVTFDADGDGDLDMVITTTHGPLHYYRNDTDLPASTWLQVELSPPPHQPPDGVGATIDLEIGALTYHRAVFGFPSFMSQDPLRVHFGFPAAGAIDRLVITWPDGTVTLRHAVAPGRLLRIRPGDTNADGTVDGLDLAAAIGAWGPCDEPCAADLDGSGAVDVDDLVEVVLGWGG